MVTAYLGLGSNLGDEIRALAMAIRHLQKKNRLLDVSPVYKTAPWGLEDQPAFHNMCIAIETQLTPQELLLDCKEIEKALLREKTVRWGPRTIDVDILIFGEEQIELPELRIPHPRMTERQFVLEPLNDIAPGLEIEGVSVANWLEKLAERKKLEPLELPDSWWKSVD